MRCEAFDGWIVECNGRRKRHAQQAAEIADQLHQLDGIEAQRRERLVQGNAVGGERPQVGYPFP